jgi:electron transfer flavoprotein alpha subunit
MSKLLILAFGPADANASIGFAQSLGLPYDVLQFGALEEMPVGAINYRVSAETFPADGLAVAIQKLSPTYSHIASVSSMQSKDILARLAGLMDAAMVTDVIGIETPTKFKRPIVAGSLIATVEVAALPVVMTFRPSGFAKPVGTANSSFESIKVESSSNVNIVSEASRESGRPDLSQAKIVVSGGRPLKTADGFENVIGSFADALGAAVGATRAAVDSGIAANELQVGQTGKIVAPDLYIAAGISGSTQHMAGIKDSKTIVAINTDPNAPIFEMADLGLVGDLYDVLPELQKLLGR